MKKIPSNYKIPFGKDYKGNTCLMTYAYGDKIDWRDNYTFTDSMQIVDYSRGRSSILFSFKSQTDGTVYPVFVSDMMDIIQNCSIINGIISNQDWSFIKKGGNYGMQLYKK